MYSDLSIIVPSKNEFENLKLIIPNLLNYSSEIIIVDSFTNDGTEKLCKELGVKYIQDNKWVGYVGLAVILLVAVQLIIGGLIDYNVLTINEPFSSWF